MANTTTSSQPRVFDGLVARAARLLARGVYRSVEVDNPEPGWSDHPCMLLANHPTGLSDPALLFGLLRRSPRFLAKSTLWDARLMGWFLDRVGAIPVYRRMDDADTSRNVEMFSAAIAVLQQGESLALFPEGKMHADPNLGEIKTGAARLALGAYESGTSGMRIVPAGIHFEDRAAVRARAYVQVGDVIELDDEIEGIVAGAALTAEDRDAVYRLTEEMTHQLQRVSPGFADVGEARSLAFAAEVALRVPDGPRRVSYANRQRVAGRLGRRSEDVRAAISADAEGYRDGLAIAEVRDADLVALRRPNRLPQRFVRGLLAMLLLAPFALAGVVMNIVPFLILRASLGRWIGPFSPPTVRLGVAIIAFGFTWLGWAGLAWYAFSWRIGLVALIAAPLYGWIAVWVLDRAVEWWRDWSGLRRARRLGTEAETLFATRTSLVAGVEGALAS